MINCIVMNGSLIMYIFLLSENKDLFYDSNIEKTKASYNYGHNLISNGLNLNMK